MSRAARATTAASTLLACLIGLLLAVGLMHWSVCEQDDRQCLVTGEPAR